MSPIELTLMLGNIAALCAALILGVVAYQQTRRVGALETRVHALESGAHYQQVRQLVDDALLRADGAIAQRDRALAALQAFRESSNGGAAPARAM